MCREPGSKTKLMHTDRHHRHERGKERCKVVDLIKINTVRQESNHRERQEQKHRAVALMGSIDRASVQGQWPCPWWPISHWLDDSHQESSVHAYLSPSLTHSLIWSLISSFVITRHLISFSLFWVLDSVTIIHLDFLFILTLAVLSSSCGSCYPMIHLLCLNMLFFPLSSTTILGDRTALTEYLVPYNLKQHIYIIRLAAFSVKLCTDTK